MAYASPRPRRPPFLSPPLFMRTIPSRMFTHVTRRWRCIVALGGGHSGTARKSVPLSPVLPMRVLVEFYRFPHWPKLNQIETRHATMKSYPDKGGGFYPITPRKVRLHSRPPFLSHCCSCGCVESAIDAAPLGDDLTPNCRARSAVVQEFIKGVFPHFPPGQLENCGTWSVHLLRTQ